MGSARLSIMRLIPLDVDLFEIVFDFLLHFILIFKNVFQLIVFIHRLLRFKDLKQFVLLFYDILNLFGFEIFVYFSLGQMSS